MKWVLQVVSLAWITASPLVAQQAVSIPPDPTCTSCSLHFTRVATLGGDTEAEGLISLRSVVVRDSEGMLYVAPTYVQGMINKYTAAGTPAGMFGQPGSGPGEHRAITELAMGPGDSLYVFDHRNARLSVWAPSGEFSRVGRLPGYPYEAIVLPDGRVVLQAWIRSPQHAGFPIHLLNTDGRIVRSFGSESGAFRRDDVFARFRALALTEDILLWSGRHNRYELELWSLDGKLQKRYVREVPWFPPQTGDGPSPQPTLRGVVYDEDGLLWVLINVRDPQWDGELDPYAEPSIERSHRMFDTMIEIIDVNTGRLLVSYRHPQAFFRFIAPGLIPITHERDDGALCIEIWNVELAR